PVRPLDDFDQALSSYCRIGIGLNEINREMGLLDVVPEVFVAPVVDKLRFIHELIRTASRHTGGATDSREARA
ncbi:MAG: putative zinc-binding metallopeptidase, partial [Halofilum sp. (in: g-proteobacteria)]